MLQSLMPRWHVIDVRAGIICDAVEHETVLLGCGTIDRDVGDRHLRTHVEANRHTLTSAVEHTWGLRDEKAYILPGRYRQGVYLAMLDDGPNRRRVRDQERRGGGDFNSLRRTSHLKRNIDGC